MAALDAPYAPLPASQDNTEWMLTNAPPPRAASTGASALVTRSGPSALVSKVVLMSAKSLVNSGPGSRVPALLTTMSTSAAWAAIAETDFSSRTSRGRLTTPVRMSAYGSRAVEYTFAAPRASTSSTSAEPRPRLPPVTNTVAPCTATMTASSNLNNVYVTEIEARSAD